LPLGNHKWYTQAVFSPQVIDLLAVSDLSDADRFTSASVFHCRIRLELCRLQCRIRRKKEMTNVAKTKEIIRNVLTKIYEKRALFVAQIKMMFRS
jgi:hypothetical protein